MEGILGYPPEVVVGALAVGLLGFWLIGVIRKVGGCLIHLALLGAGLVILFYILAVSRGGI